MIAFNARSSFKGVQRSLLTATITSSADEELSMSSCVSNATLFYRTSTINNQKRLRSYYVEIRPFHFIGSKAREK